MKDAEDAILVGMALAGRQEAFEILVDRYHKLVYSVARKMVNDPDDAADVAQNVFIKMYLHLGKYDPRHKFFSWVYRITVNEALNHLNQRHYRTEQLDESFRETGTPESAAQQTELETKIHRALMKLKPDHRAVIVLTHFQGLSYRETAEALGIPEKTVKSRLFTSRQILKDLLITDGIVEA